MVAASLAPALLSSRLSAQSTSCRTSDSTGLNATRERLPRRLPRQARKPATGGAVFSSKKVAHRHWSSTVTRCKAAQDQGVVTPPGGGKDLQLQVATSTYDFRAAGFLRAHAFNSSFAEERSEFVRRSYQRMRGDMEWNAVEGKVMGTEVSYKGVRVTCLIATLPCNGSGSSGLEANLRAELDPTCLLPMDESHAYPRMVVASLDINQGARLPAEELAGNRPGRGDNRGDPATCRAYISNVCTAAPIRRMGVAASLVEAACSLASQQGVTDCYVHVAEDNPGAEHLYRQVCGFSLEAEETASFAKIRNRPRRLLLHRSL